MKFYIVQLNDGRIKFGITMLSAGARHGSYIRTVGLEIDTVLAYEIEVRTKKTLRDMYKLEFPSWKGSGEYVDKNRITLFWKVFKTVIDELLQEPFAVYHIELRT